jgi:hypothetical protein
MTGRRRRRHGGAAAGDSGQITAFVVVMATALVLLAGLVLDGGLTLAARGRALNLAQEAARAGAQGINLAVYRQTGDLVLSVPLAAADAQQYRHPGHRPGHREHRHRHRHRYHHPADADPRRSRAVRDHRPRHCQRGTRPQHFRDFRLMTSRARLPRSLPRVIGRLVAAAVLLGALPYALARFIGWPLPRHPTLHGVQQFLVSPLSDDAIIKGLACVAWLLWAVFVLSFLIEVASAIRGQPAPRLPAIAPVQAFAAALVGATVLTAVPGLQAGPHGFPLEHALAAHVVAAASPLPGQPGPALAPIDEAPTLDASTTGGTAVLDAVTSRPRVYRVVEGDDLWEIAARFLGDGDRWPEIYGLNAGKPQPDGQALTDPDLIEPGWVLLLPAAPGGVAPNAHAHPNHPREHPHARPASPSARPSPSARASFSARSSPRAGNHPGTHPLGPAVSLPSGTIIGLSLAITAATALALARRHRRRHRQPASVPGTAAAEPGLTPALSSILRARQAASQQQSAETTDPGATPAPQATVTADDEIPPRDGPSTETINVAVRDDQEIPLDLGSVAGIGLTGSGAADAIRAIAITLLARRTRDQGEVVLCGEEASQLLAAGDEPVPEVPGLDAFPDPGDGLALLEAEIIHRRRLLDAADSDDLTAYRDANPDESLPTILVIASAATPHAGRLAAMLALGRQLGIVGVLVGPWSAGVTCEVAGNGMVASVTAPARHLSDAQMYQLARGEALEVLTTLAGASGSGATLAETGEPRFLPAPPAEQPGTSAEERPARVAILGSFQLSAGGQPVTKGLRRKAAELLAYLTIHGDGATTAAILDALWQDTPVERVGPILHACTTNIRKILREATGASETALIIRTNDHAGIDPRLVSTDLWQFRDALATAAHAASDAERYARLLVAASLWRGDIVPGMDSLWIDEQRETLRRDAVDTLARLAELSESGDPEQALAHLER